MRDAGGVDLLGVGPLPLLVVPAVDTFEDWLVVEGVGLDGWLPGDPADAGKRKVAGLARMPRPDKLSVLLGMYGPVARFGRIEGMVSWAAGCAAGVADGGGVDIITVVSFWGPMCAVSLATTGTALPALPAACTGLAIGKLGLMGLERAAAVGTGFVTAGLRRGVESTVFAEPDCDVGTGG